MGVFSFLKKKEAKTAVPIPEVPELAFPEIPMHSEPESIESAPETIPEISEEISVSELSEIPEAPGIIPDIEELGAEEHMAETPELRFSARRTTKPLFINVDNYRELMEQLSNAKSVLAEHAGFSSKLGDIKVSKDESYEKFRGNLEAIERKLLYIDKIIFEGG